MTAKSDYEALLAKLSELDGSLIETVKTRFELARELAKLQQAHSGEYLPLPPKGDLLGRAEGQVTHPRDGAVRAIFAELHSATAALIKPTRVVCRGASGGFAYMAAVHHFGQSAELETVGDVAAVFDALVRERAEFGVVPLETSSDGAVTETLNALAGSDLHLCGEVSVRQRHTLVGAEDASRVFGDAVALAACARTLRGRFPNATFEDVASGADAVARAGGESAAAVVSAFVAERSNLPVVAENVDDVAGVRVRYGIVGGRPESRSGRDRTALAMAMSDAPGALHLALQPFADRSINLTRLESRPAAGAPWPFVFFVEFDGHVTDRNVASGVEDVRQRSRWVKVLGSYPRPNADDVIE